MSRPVVVVGGGFAALEFALTLKKVDAAIPVTVVSRETATVYRPLLIRQPADGSAAPVVPFATLLADAGVTLVDAIATAADVDRQRLSLDTGAELDYDPLVVATGACADRDRIPGAREHAIFPCDLDGAERLAEAVAAGSPRVAIVFGWERPGPGLEYAAWIAARRPDVRLDVVDGDGTLDRRVGPRATAWLEQLFRRRGARLVAGRGLERVTDRGIELHGIGIEADVVALAAPIRGVAGWLPPALLDAHGRLRVNRSLAAAPGVFGLGDVLAEPPGVALAPTLMAIRKLAPRLARSVAAVRAGRSPAQVLGPAGPSMMLPDLCGTAMFVRDRRLLMTGPVPRWLRSSAERRYLRARAAGDREHKQE